MSIQVIAEGAPRVASLSNAEKLREAIFRSRNHMPAEAWESVKELLSPESLQIMTVVTLGWAISHFFGVGQIADVILLTIGAFTLGASVTRLGNDCLEFAGLIRNAQTEADLDKAGQVFADMVILAGITTLSALFMVKRPPVFKEQFLGGMHRPPPPTNRGLFYQPPPPRAVPLRPNEGGFTTRYGDIFVNVNRPPWAMHEALLHERIHQILTPKLFFLREVRIELRMQSYSRSYILRYLEEALAQTYALVKSRGPGWTLEGIRFPVKNGYMTIAGAPTAGWGSLANEALGICLGPINVGGAFSYQAFFTNRHSSGASGSW